MARSREQIEIFSLSFLDLIFCAMAGILVLYSIADSSEPQDESLKLPTLIEVEFNDAIEASVVRVSVQNGTRQHIGSTVNGGEWTFTNNPLIARLKLTDELKSNRNLEIELVDFDWVNGADDMPFRIRVMSPTSGVKETSKSLSQSNLRFQYAF